MEFRIPKLTDRQRKQMSQRYREARRARHIPRSSGSLAVTALARTKMTQSILTQAHQLGVDVTQRELEECTLTELACIHRAVQAAR